MNLSSKLENIHTEAATALLGYKIQNPEHTIDARD